LWRRSGLRDKPALRLTEHLPATEGFNSRPRYAARDHVQVTLCASIALATLGEDVAQDGGKRVRLARPAELASEEAAVVAREDDGFRSQALRDR
jgi:hypothetical protein